MTIHLTQEAQIALLLVKKISVLKKYLDFADIFFEKLVEVLPEWIKLNKHVIELQKSKQPLYSPIYSLSLIELEILKTYIKINLANGFIQLSKSLARALVFFIQKPDGSLRLYINYQRFNNFTIKNWYLLHLIEKFLD